MYKGASNGSQRHLHRLTTIDAMKNAGASDLNSAEREKQLKSAIYQADLKLAQLAKGSPMRKVIAKQKHQMQQERANINAARSGKVSADYMRVTAIFRQCVREVIGEDHGKALWRKAMEMYAIERELPFETLFGSGNQTVRPEDISPNSREGEEQSNASEEGVR